MKFLLPLFCALPFLLCAQDTLSVDSAQAAVDTTIYNIADEAPRFPSRCETLDTVAAVKSQCAQIALLDFVNRRVIYPQEAREQNISGMAVIGFTVEKNGRISIARILKDPGGGLGLAALRAVASMASEVGWRPAFIDKKPVRFNYVLPIRFRLEEEKPYVLTDRDTVYVKLTKPLAFSANDGDLAGYFSENISYPSIGEDSCRTGQLDLQLLVHPDGRVDVQDIIDYNNLGTDFTFEAINVATGSYGKWSPGEYEGRPVTSAYDVSFSFAPESAGCQETVNAYNVAVRQMVEGQRMAQDSATLSAGLEKMGEAIDMFPNDGRFRIMRGQVRMDNNRLQGACEDLSIAKRLALIDWFDSVLPLICRRAEEE